LIASLKHINATLLVLMALVYFIPNFKATTYAVIDGIEEISQESSASDIEEKDFFDEEVILNPNCSDDDLWFNFTTLNYLNNQVPIEPVINRPTPPPQG
jgi:hypothetical protein